MSLDLRGKSPDDLWDENVSEFPKDKAVSPQLRAALEHAAEGFRVFPLPPGSKEPFKGRSWLKMATTNPEQIKTWWRENPDYNVAIDTTDWFVIDIDVLKGGADTWALHEVLEEIPETREAETRSGGRHLIFKPPPDTLPISGSSKTANKVFGQGIDLRSHHNYICAPGSVVAVDPGATGPGCYRWRNKLKPATTPQWMLDRCNTVRPKEANAGEWVVEKDTPWALQRFEEYMRDEAPEAFQGSNRHATSLTPIHAGYDWGCSAETILERMLTWNEERCHPPLTLEHIERNVRTVTRNSARGSRHPEYLAKSFEAVEIEEEEDEAGSQGDDAPKLKLAYLKLAQWDTKQIPPREWAVEDRVPIRNVFHVAGAGAVGKSLLELQRGVAHVIAQQREGITWIGLAVRPGPVIYYGAEDDEEEIARRLADIAAHYQTTFADLERGGLHVLTYAGKDALLGAPDANNRRIVATAEYGKLLEDAGKIKPVAIIIDTRNDTFGGNEIDRTEVRQYVGLLRKLAIAAGGSVSMCDHPSLAGMRDDTGLSGSTAWHNSVRARAYLTKAKDDGLPGAAGDLRELRFLKNNYGREESAIRVRWQCGVFVPVTAFDAERIEMKEAAGRLFLTLLARLTNEGRNVSHKKGPTYAPALFAKQPEAQSAGIGAQAFADAMEVLFQSGRVRVEPYGKPSDHRVRLVAVS
jgi:RecA-family ATPase